MPSSFVSALALVLLAPVGLLAADAPGVGTWKFRLTGESVPVILLVAITPNQQGEFLGSVPPFQQAPKITSVALKDGEVRFRVTVNGREFLSFEGKHDAERNRVRGAYTQLGKDLRPTDLLPSELKKLEDPIELLREEIKQRTFGSELFDAGFEFMSLAAEKKLPTAEVREAAEKLAKAASAYGVRYERMLCLRIASILLEQKGYAESALAQARRAERLLEDDAPPLVALEVLETLARALTAAEKPADAARVRATIARLEARDYSEYMKNGLEAPPFPGRKGNSQRVTLLEVFTGAECPPCVGVDLAVDAILKAYKPTDVVVLQYHIHVPAPDPLTSPDGMNRLEYYSEIVQGAPTVILNGKAGPGGGGPAGAAATIFNRLGEQLAQTLEKPSAVRLSVKVAEGKASATVTGLESAIAAKSRVRFALVEERVRYAGGNGVRYHHQVLRAMPGGTAGMALDSGNDVSVPLDIPAERKRLAEYLDDYAQKESPFPRSERPLDLKKLKLIVFVQEDSTREVLAATMIDLPEAPE